MSRPPTVAEALDAHLDYATETGEYSQALRERIAAVLPELRILGPWRHGHRYDLLTGMPVASVVRAWGRGVLSVLYRGEDRIELRAPRSFSSEEEARWWCDEQARALGWVLCP